MKFPLRDNSITNWRRVENDKSFPDELIRFCYDNRSYSYGDSDSINHSFNGYLGFYCPKCFYPFLVHARINIDLEYKHYFANDEEDNINFCTNYTITCPKCGQSSTYDHYLDPAITPNIALLNKKGYKTLFSCQGHNHRRDYSNNDTWGPVDSFLNYGAYIMFCKEVNMENIIKKYPLPSIWKLDTYPYLANGIVIRCDDDHDDLMLRMVTLYDWINMLPDRNNAKS